MPSQINAVNNYNEHVLALQHHLHTSIESQMESLIDPYNKLHKAAYMVGQDSKLKFLAGLQYTFNEDTKEPLYDEDITMDVESDNMLLGEEYELKDSIRNFHTHQTNKKSFSKRENRTLPSLRKTTKEKRLAKIAIQQGKSVSVSRNAWKEV